MRHTLTANPEFPRVAHNQQWMSIRIECFFGSTQNKESIKVLRIKMFWYQSNFPFLLTLTIQIALGSDGHEFTLSYYFLVDFINWYAYNKILPSTFICSWVLIINHFFHFVKHQPVPLISLFVARSTLFP